MKLTLPFPPSTNTAYANVRGRRVKTKKAREYAEAVTIQCLAHPVAKQRRRDATQSIPPAPPRLTVRIEAFPPDRRRRDLANMEKLAIDAIFAYLGLDDSLIDDLHLTRRELDRPDGHLEVTISEAA